MTHYHKLILDNSQMQILFGLKDLEKDLTQISSLIQSLLAEKDWHVSQVYIAQAVRESHEASNLPLEGTVFFVEANTAAKLFTCRAQATSGNETLVAVTH